MYTTELVNDYVIIVPKPKSHRKQSGGKLVNKIAIFKKVIKSSIT